MVYIVFASSNIHKVSEINSILEQTAIRIKSLKDIGCEDDIPETQTTIEGNALQKANYVVENYQVDCFAEDTGLEIEALNGEPGVFTARYAGEKRDAVANMNLVLAKMQQIENRKARFKTVIALVLNGQTELFEGIINGTIAQQPQGQEGFGYDPIFIPDGYSVSFAEMDSRIKNSISHRAIAVHKLTAFLEKLKFTD